MRITTRLTGMAALAALLTLLPALPVNASEAPPDRPGVTLADDGLAVSSGGLAELTSAQSAELTALDKDLPAIQAATVGGTAAGTAASVEACSRNGTGVELAFAGFICWAQ
ncbi:hypothetical protein [Leifsonia sp. EB34]|uniref:hypothetical protein n=1 Tax=Leifsonia sp. EB34 TaxID=3156303 RepID=UPI00351874AE